MSTDKPLTQSVLTDRLAIYGIQWNPSQNFDLVYASVGSTIGFPIKAGRRLDGT